MGEPVIEYFHAGKGFIWVFINLDKMEGAFEIFGNLGDEWCSSTEPPCVVYGEIMIEC